VPRGLPLGGTLIAISERGLTRDGNLNAFLIGGPRPGTFALRRTAEFDISDAALLPSGDLLVLERKFSWTTGLSVHRGPNGETVLTLVSDDNFSALQRTLLLQFTLAEP
jgi:hypothetical protein